MHLDPIMPLLTGITLVILLIGLFLRVLRQPHVVGYLIAGVILGPSGLRVITDEATLSQLGAIGVVLLLFFVGMEVVPRRLMAKVLAVLLINTFINGIILRLLGDNWRESLYTGSLLAQIGEFSFVLAAVGKQSQIITAFAYQETLAVIALTLLLSPAWIRFMKRMLGREPSAA